MYLEHAVLCTSLFFQITKKYEWTRQKKELRGIIKPYYFLKKLFTFPDE